MSLEELNKLKEENKNKNINKEEYYEGLLKMIVYFFFFNLNFF